MSVTNAQLVELYLAYFGRPPDVAGLRYYLDPANKFELADVVRGFNASPESVAMYGTGFGAAQINAIYRNLFNRDAEPAGVDFWLEAVSSGRITPAEAALTILHGAQNSDRTSVANKITISTEFLAQLDTAREIAGYAGDGAAALARTYLQTVDASDASLAAALAVLQAQVNVVTGATSPPPPAPPPVFTVTKDAGNIVSFGAPGAQIDVAEAGGTYTFTSGTASGTVTGTVAGIVVPTGTTLSISSTLASGKAFTGAGTALVVAAASADLTAFTATGVDGFQLTAGSNYVLTAAQAAIGRIGASGAVGTLTDSGTTTVIDTLTALGGGVAATLKANGVDIVIASAPPGNISAVDVAGINSINLDPGNYTMTAAQAALVGANTDAQVVTLTTQASGTLKAAVESFVLGDFANNVTLGIETQNVSSPGGAVATTLAVNAMAASGSWALAHTTGDTLVATNGVDVSTVNAGAATTTENLMLTGAITMTQVQHQAMPNVTTGGGSDSMLIVGGGAVTARAGVESYLVSRGGITDLTVNAGATNVDGSATTNVYIGGNTVSGTYALAGIDRIFATDGANITGINSGGLTTAENLTFAGAITMTRAQYQPLTITGGPGADEVIITTGGDVAAQAGVEKYTLSASGSNTFIQNSGGWVLAGSGNATTVNVGDTAGGTWTLLHGSDVINAGNNSNIAAVNGGAATTAETLIMTDNVTMTAAQHDAFTTFTASGSFDTVNIYGGGDLTVRAGVESYSVSNSGSSKVTVGTSAVTIIGNAANATTIVVGGNTVAGQYALGNGADVIEATTGANIAGANTSQVERLTLTGAITMTAVQYTKFITGGITTGSINDRIILTATLTGQILDAGVENFTLFAADNLVNGLSGQSIDAQALTAGQTLTINGASGKVSLDAGNVTSVASGAIEVTGGTGANTITTGAGNDIVNAGDGADTITGGNGVDILNGGDGNDIFRYGSIVQFLSLASVIDQIDGGAGTDAVEIAGGIVLTGSTDLTRMIDVEQIKVLFPQVSGSTHNIVLGSNKPGSLNTVDLSGDERSSSNATIDFSGVTTAMTLKGVALGINNITGGSGVDTLVGGNGSDTFYYATAASFISGTGSAVVDSINGGGGSNDVIQVNGAFSVGGAQSLDRVSNVEILRNEVNVGVGRTFALDFQSDASLGSITKIDLSYDQSPSSAASVALTGASRAMTVTGLSQGTNVLIGGSGADTLTGGQLQDTFRGGAGNDRINSGSGAATYIFEATTSANGNDELWYVGNAGKFDFRPLLGATSVKNALIDATSQNIDLDMTGYNIGFRHSNDSLIGGGTTDDPTVGNIREAGAGTTSITVAGEVVMANDSKAVIFSFASNSLNRANGKIYYVEDVASGAAVDWAVTQIGSMSSSNIDASNMPSAVHYF